MVDYIGARSLDAEIFLNLDPGNPDYRELLMDYSLNSKGSPYDSNTSTILKNDFKNLKGKEKIIAFTRKIMICYFFISYSVITCPILTFCTKHKILKNKAWQLQHQKLLKILFANLAGIVRVIIPGPYPGTEIKHYLAKNIWMGYTLEGDFQEQIKSIALKRHFVTKQHFGKYETIRQNGWDLILLFRNPPQHGSCLIEYV